MSSKTAKTPTPKTPAKAAKAALSKAKTRNSDLKKSATTRKTISTLSTDLKSLESRLKGADTKNRNALKTLEVVVAELQSATKKSNSTQKAALTRGLTALEARIETYLSRASQLARSGVKEELAAVTASDAGLDTLGEAVKSAHARLDTIDAAQRESIARLNRHIAGLATSVESRLNDEAKARQASSAELNTKIETVRETFTARVDQVELDTATALESIGGKVAEFAAVLEQRSHTSDADTAERLADLAQETQSEFNTAQTEVTTRLEALEIIAANWSPTAAVFPANMEDPRVDQMAQTVVSLQDELRRMHARVAMLQAPTANSNTPADIALVPTNVVPISAAPFAQPTPDVMDNPYSEAALALQASAASQAMDVPVRPSTLNPSAGKTKNSHIPQEFDPSAYAPAPSMPAPDAAAQRPLAPPQTLSQPPITAPPMASLGGHFTAPALPETAHVIEPIMPAPLPVSTYADPAYAEADDMRAQRIGEDTTRRKPSLPKLPVSSRNLRVGALAASLAVVGLIAGKTLLGGNNDSSFQAQNEVKPNIAAQAPQTVSSPSTGFTPAATTETTPPIAPMGLYAETRTPNVIPGTEDTLDTAVAAGNPIAQFQKGLVKLQTGQVEEGANLIRLAANRNQPAAQYRLAKLYESGTGLTKDLVTARELVERAAIGGNRIAMHDLGNYYAYGQGGLDRDMGQALDWFSKAAERGVVDSQFNVAFLREGNEGVTADPESALFWYYIAARQGDQGAPERISVLTAQLDANTQAGIKSRAERFTPKPVDEAANGIFRDVPWAKVAKTGDAVKSAQILKIREAQTLLSDLGYQIGKPDGAAGPKTRAAIKEFETVNGLPETGEISDALLERLEIAVGA